MIGLVDGNNFYVSCERVFDPSLEQCPVGILSNNDGCVISRSQEFKDLGIAMGTPYFKLKPLLARTSIVLKSSNYALYGDMSRRMISILNEFTPNVEQYSIDEAFITVNLPESGDYTTYAKTIRQCILDWIGIPCGIGFAQTKTLAKIANHIAKKRLDGVFVMPEHAGPSLQYLPVGDVWGIGSRLTEALSRFGIRTAAQLAEADTHTLRKKFSVTVARTGLELRGIPAVTDETPDAPSQSVSCSRSFGRPVVDLEELEEAVTFYTASSAEKLRKERQVAAGANVYFQYYPEYGTDQADGGFTGTTVAFDPPTDDTSAMLHQIRPVLKGLFLPSRRYKKAGIVLYGLEGKNAHAPDLFLPVNSTAKRDALYAAIDHINAEHGRGTVFALSEGINRKWAMKRDWLSPRFTTNWNDLPTAR